VAVSIVLVVPDTHVRGLRDGALVNHLASDVARGLRGHHRTGLVAGHRVHLAQADPAEDDELAYALEHRTPGTASVARHKGWTEVTLMPGYKVSLYDKEAFR
jgi:hypothetical protein